MFHPQKSLLYVLMFAIIFGVVIFGMLTSSNGEGRPSGTTHEREHKITRVLRSTDDYFAGMSDREIVQSGHVVCTLLRQGSSIDAVIDSFPHIPAGPVGDLIDQAISRYCPDSKPALQGFLSRYSRP